MEASSHPLAYKNCCIRLHMDTKDNLVKPRQEMYPPNGHQFTRLDQRARLQALERKLTHQRMQLRNISLRSHYCHRRTDTLELCSWCRTTHSKLQKLRQSVRRSHTSTTDSTSSGGRAPSRGSENSKSAREPLPPPPWNEKVFGSGAQNLPCLEASDLLGYADPNICRQQPSGTAAYGWWRTLGARVRIPQRRGKHRSLL